MVKEGIVLGHKISKKGIEVDNTTLGSSRSPNFPQGSINPCDGSSIVTLNKRFVGGTPFFRFDCPDCEDSQFCHSSKSFTSSASFGNPIS
ncbi:hypothetical protein Tco_0202687 [Tanacetum coccineum]